MVCLIAPVACDLRTAINSIFRGKIFFKDFLLICILKEFNSLTKNIICIGKLIYSRFLLLDFGVSSI